MQGCQVGPFGAKFHNFGPKLHFLAQKFSFEPLDLFWRFSKIDWLLQELDLTTLGSV